MLKDALRIVLVIVIVVAAVAFFLGYRWGAPHEVLNQPTVADRPIATTGQGQDSRVEHAREAGAAVGEKVAVGAERASEALDDAGITAKIKSKIALDDTLKGSDIHISTTGHAVTLGGSVANDAQHRRAVELARETNSVTSVDDHLTVGVR